MDRLQQLISFLEAAPDDSFTLYSIAYEYMNREAFEEACTYFERLRKSDPNYIGLYYHLGKTLERLDKPEEAIGVYHDGISRARKRKETRALSELQGALNSALGLDYEDDV